MNYYEQHLGDYARDTMHLSMLEHGAYRLLLDRCYASEKPLPADAKKVQRLAGARTRAERHAVDTVLGEFFVLEEDGWHNPRCDVELARYWEGQGEREAKKEGEENRGRRHREERAAICEKLRQAGVKFAWNAKIDELRELLGSRGDNTGEPLPTIPPAAPKQEPVTQPATAKTEPATQPATAKNQPATATQSPVTNNQTPEKTVASTHDPATEVVGVRAATASVTAPATAPATATVTVTEPVAAAGATPVPRAQVGLALRAVGADMTRVNTADPRLDALLAQGATPEQFAGLWQEAAGKGIKAPWPWVLTVLPERIAEAKAMATVAVCASEVTAAVVRPSAVTASRGESRQAALERRNAEVARLFIEKHNAASGVGAAQGGV